MDMDKFEFTLSADKFAEMDETVDNTVYFADLVSDDVYMIRWKIKDGWGGLEYTKAEVEVNIEDGFWIKVERGDCL